MLYDDKQLDAAEEIGSVAISLLSDTKANECTFCECCTILRNTYNLKGKMPETIDHLKTAFRIATTFTWETRLLWIHHSMATIAC